MLLRQMNFGVLFGVLSVLSSVRFPEIGSLVFSETVVRGPYIVVCVTEPDFFGKIPIGQK